MFGFPGMGRIDWILRMQKGFGEDGVDEGGKSWKE